MVVGIAVPGVDDADKGFQRVERLLAARAAAVLVIVFVDGRGINLNGVPPQILGAVQGGVRPVLVIQNDIGNKHSPTVICAAITSQMHKAKLPTHVELNCDKYDLAKDSVVLLEQLRTIDKKRLKDKVCHLDHQILLKIDKALEISLELYT